MQVSEKGLKFIEGFEGCVLHAYQDQVGVWTIGYGSTTGVYPGLEITQEQAQERLQSDAQTAVNAVNRFVTIALNQNQFDALVDFTFNLGAGSLEHSTLLRLLNEGHYLEASDEFEKWDYAGGEPNEGLRKRRIAESTLFLTPVSA